TPPPRRRLSSPRWSTSRESSSISRSPASFCGERCSSATIMPRLRVQSFAISIDGYGAGPNQDLENPLGVRGPELMEWFFATGVWRRMHGQEGGEAGVDNDMAGEGLAGIGAWILGRNMF